MADDPVRQRDIREQIARGGRGGRGKPPRVFYMSLSHSAAGEHESGHGSENRGWARLAGDILELYGVGRAINEIDRGREWWRDGPHLIGEVLDWVSNEGFAAVFGPYGSLVEKYDGFRGFEEHTVHEWRQRYMLQVMAAIVKAGRI